MKTLGDRLISVQTAIAKIEDPAVGEYTINGRTLKRPDLDTLYKREERLMVLINSQNVNRKARIVTSY